MKAVLISIRPKWVELIASGKKTVEIRKTRPKLETPFRCYIYCTNKGEMLYSVNGKVQPCNSFEINLKENSCVSELNGYVVGEFVCDWILDIFISSSDPNLIGYPVPGTGLTDREIMDYLGNGKPGYGWHISKLEIYDEPKALREFTPCCKFMLDEKQCDYRKIQCLNQQDSFLEEDGCNCLNFVKRPPQSYMYVEEMTT